MAGCFVWPLGAKAELLCERGWLFCLGFACEKSEPLLGKIGRKVGYSVWILGVRRQNCFAGEIGCFVWVLLARSRNRFWGKLGEKLAIPLGFWVKKLDCFVGEIACFAWLFG